MTKWTWNDAMRRRIRDELVAVSIGPDAFREQVTVADLRTAFINEGVSMSYFESGCRAYLRWLADNGQPGIAWSIVDSICALWAQANEAMEAQQLAMERLSMFDRWGNRKGLAFIHRQAVHESEEA